MARRQQACPEGPASCHNRPKGSPSEPSEAGTMGKGGARKQTKFSPLGGNEVERTLRRRAAAELRGRVCRLTPAPDGEHFITLSCSPVKWGSLGGEGPMEPGRPLAGASSGAHPLSAFLVTFCANKKSPPGGRDGLMGWQGPPLLWLPKEMRSGKPFFQRRSLWPPSSAPLMRGTFPHWGKASPVRPNLALSPAGEFSFLPKNISRGTFSSPPACYG